MGVGTGLYMYDVVVKMFTFAISSTDEFLFYLDTLYGFNVKTKKIPSHIYTEGASENDYAIVDVILTAVAATVVDVVTGEYSKQTAVVEVTCRSTPITAGAASAGGVHTCERRTIANESSH